MSKFRKQLFFKLFKNEIKEIRESYEEQIETYKKIIAVESEKTIKAKTGALDIVYSILDDNRQIVGYDKNKEDEEVFVVQWIFGNDIWFLLYSNKYRACNKHPRIMATICKEFTGNSMQSPKYDIHVRIDDILVEDNNVGNGSILMPYFIEYCKEIDAEYISGWLSSVDKEHFDRSERFYKKHGFDVKFNEDRSSGNIKLKLK